jgi:hypothetical protein
LILSQAGDVNGLSPGVACIGAGMVTEAVMIRNILAPVRVSVLQLYRDGKRLSDYEIKIQQPAVGWLIIEPVPESYRSGALQAKLLGADGKNLLPLLDSARVTASGLRGMLIQGVGYRRKGTKHAIHDRQAWWCQAPPVEHPMIDHAEEIRRAVALIDAQKSAGW